MVEVDKENAAPKDVADEEAREQAGWMHDDEFCAMSADA